MVGLAGRRTGQSSIPGGRTDAQHAGFAGPAGSRRPALSLAQHRLSQVVVESARQVERSNTWRRTFWNGRLSCALSAPPSNARPPGTARPRWCSARPASARPAWSGRSWPRRPDAVRVLAGRLRGPADARAHWARCATRPADRQGPLAGALAGGRSPTSCWSPCRRARRSALADRAGGRGRALGRRRDAGRAALPRAAGWPDLPGPAGGDLPRRRARRATIRCGRCSAG